MLIFAIIPTNLKFLTVLNGGVTPQLEADATYLVIEPGKPNRIISYKDFANSEFDGMKVIQRQFYYV